MATIVVRNDLKNKFRVVTTDGQDIEIKGTPVIPGYTIFETTAKLDELKKDGHVIVIDKVEVSQPRKCQVIEKKAANPNIRFCK